LLTLEAQRLLDAMGAETRVFDPAGLPLPDGHPESHPKVQEYSERKESAAKLEARVNLKAI
jgi:arsenic resistance protein ArsH